MRKLLEPAWRGLAGGSAAAIACGTDRASVEREIREAFGEREIRSSVSHTRTEAGTVTLIAAIDARAQAEVGVDLEAAARESHPGLLHRLVRENSWESRIGLEPLEYWVIKEAAFKATPRNQGLVLSQFEVAWFDTESRSGRVEGPHLEGLDCRFRLLRSTEWVAALALTSRM